MTQSEEKPQQFINGELKPLSGMEATSNIPAIKSKAEYLKAVMYEGVRLPQHLNYLRDYFLWFSIFPICRITVFLLPPSISLARSLPLTPCR